MYALVDCNTFYVSCERLFRPDLKNKPVIVLSNNDGCAVSRSQEAKALGIYMGAPYFKVRDLCRKNRVHVFSSNYALYGDLSHRVMQSLSQFSPDVLIYSIDEAFLYLPSKQTSCEYAENIRSKVLTHTGIPVSVGIAPTKVLAKAASELAKKTKPGVLVLKNEATTEEYLQNFPVEDLWGIGRKSTQKLYALGIFTALELRKANAKRIRKTLGILGERIVLELNGESCIDLHHLDMEKKSIISSQSFGRTVTDISDIKEAIANHVSKTCEKLRKQQSLCRYLYISLRSQHDHWSSNALIPSGSNVTPTLITKALALVEKLFKPGTSYKKSGVYLCGLVPEGRFQGDLFEQGDRPIDQQLMKTLDHLNQKFGATSLRFASCGTQQDWKMLSNMRSPCYTTRWKELLKVK